MKGSYIQNINGNKFLVIETKDKHGRKTRTMRKLPNNGIWNAKDLDTNLRINYKENENAKEMVMTITVRTITPKFDVNRSSDTKSGYYINALQSTGYAQYQIYILKDGSKWYLEAEDHTTEDIAGQYGQAIFKTLKEAKAIALEFASDFYDAWHVRQAETDPND